MRLKLQYVFDQDRSLTPRIGPTLSSARADTATYFDSSGVLQTAAVNEARFDHNPATGESLGLLHEPGRENLFLRSNDFSLIWAETGATIDSNVDVGPDGATSMDRLNVDAGGTVHFTSQSLTQTADETYATFVFMKDDGAGYGGFTRTGGTGAEHIAILADLTNGTIVDTNLGSTSVAGDLVDYGCEDIGNGIFLVWMVGNINETTTFNQIFISESAAPSWDVAGRPTYSATAGADVLIFGAQMELAADKRRSSYIPTGATSEVRVVDGISTTDMSWFNALEGTFYVKSRRASLGQGNVLTLSNGTADERMSLIGSSLGNSSFLAWNTAVQCNIIITSIYDDELEHETATVYKLNDFVHYVDGVQGTPDNSGVVPSTMSVMHLGALFNGGEVWHGHIAEMRYYNTRLSNQELELLSLGNLPGGGGSPGLAFGAMGKMGVSQQ